MSRKNKTQFTYIKINFSELKDMGIEKNRDLLSLVTCTPYGINTKRLVVRAKRVFPKKKEKNVRKSYSFRELCFILIPIICVMVVIW